MFFVLSKTLYHLLMPSGMACVWAVLALWQGRRRRLFLGILCAWLLAFTNPWLANEALLWWETPPLTAVGTYSVGVLLSGMRNVDKSPRERVQFMQASDRLLQTVFLYRAGHIQKIIVTGADYIAWDGQIDSTKDELRQALVACGIPDSAIITEGRAVNTAENAAFTAQLLRQHFPQNPRVLLITSAFHGRRAAACFKKQGVAFDLYSCDFQSADRSRLSLLDFFPKARAMHYFELIGKEMIGMLVYRWRGQL